MSSAMARSLYAPTRDHKSYISDAAEPAEPHPAPNLD